MTIVEDKNDPYERIIQTMKKEYIHSIPLVDGKVSESFREFIKMLFTPEEAEVAQYLTTRPQGAGKIAKKIGKSRAWVNQQIKAGEIKTVTINGAILVKL